MFFDELGRRKHSIQAVSIDMNGSYEKAIRASVPNADVCFDPFHVIRLAGDAVTPSAAPSGTRTARARRPPGAGSSTPAWSLLKAPERHTIPQLARLGEVAQTNRRLYRAFLLYHALRPLYRLDDPALAPAHLKAWLAWASRSRLKPFVRLARTLRARRDGILAAIRLASPIAASKPSTPKSG